MWFLIWNEEVIVHGQSCFDFHLTENKNKCMPLEPFVDLSILLFSQYTQFGVIIWDPAWQLQRVHAFKVYKDSEV